MIAGIVLLIPCSFMAIYGFTKMDHSSNYALLQIVGWAGILTYILQFLIVEGIERTEKQVYFFVDLLFWAYFGTVNASLWKEKSKLHFNTSPSKNSVSTFIQLRSEACRAYIKHNGIFVVSFSNRDTVRKMISIIKQEI